MLRTITILSADFSGNALGRAYLLAKLLQDDYRVRIVAFGAGKHVWSPVQNDTSVEYRSFHHSTASGLFLHSGRIVRRLIDGDLVIAVKPLLPSFGLGLYARRLLRRPLLLDIDDWEVGFLTSSVYWEMRQCRHKWILDANSPFYTRVLDRVTRWADALTVSNTYLQRRYGGHWIPHARDASKFHNPSVVSDVKSVMFLGTARENKGLDVLLSAWLMVKDPKARLRIIGTLPSSPILKELRTKADHRVSFEGPVAFDDMPTLLCSAGIVAIPQQQVLGSVGQLPAKLIDAMAAARPIVSTSVGDIPKWLAGHCGSIVAPGDPRALAEAINDLLTYPIQAQKMGQLANQRFHRFGSFAAVRSRFLPLVADLIAGRPKCPATPAFFDPDIQRIDDFSNPRLNCLVKPNSKLVAAV